METRPTTTDPPKEPSGTTRRRRGPDLPGRGVLIVALAIFVSAAAAVVVASIVSSAEARFAGSTSNRGSFLESGEVTLELVADADDPEAERAELAITGANLLPGQMVERCIVLGYTGSVDDAEVRIHARDDRLIPDPLTDDLGDTGPDGRGLGGLAPYLLVTMTVGSGLDSECGDFVVLDTPGDRWEGTLLEFGRHHDDYASGLPVLEDASDGATATIRISVTLADDNRAQGLSSAFWLVFEVRP